MQVMIMILRHVIGELLRHAGEALEALAKRGCGGGQGFDLNHRAFIKRGGTFQNDDAAFDFAHVFHGAQATLTRMKWQWRLKPMMWPLILVGPQDPPGSERFL